ncbi:MAG: hypothetical protein KI790_00680 [Cyclobacteriaceae bacterium]|nr:hypothetical protein [Cyclobacteriaceae bacterium HetDA_MAG_MS6]
MIIIRQILHLSLATLILVSSTSFTVYKHYCMGRLQAVSIFTEPHVCMSESGDSQNCLPDCCNDTSEEVHANDEAGIISNNQSLQDAQLVPVVYVLIEEIISPSNDSTFPRAYKPPLIANYIPAVIQIFLL